jgi:hypothetical protein
VIWIVPAAVAAAAFFKLGTLHVWVQVLALVVKAMVGAGLFALAAAAGLLGLRMRRRRQ